MATLDRRILLARNKVLALGPKLDCDLERLHRDIRLKIERGELSPEIARVMNKPPGTDQA